MLSAPMRENEASCLAALAALGMLDTQSSPEFEAMVRTAAQSCGAPMATIGLVDADREWFKARIGMGDVAQLPRELAFGAHVVLADGLFEVPDTLRDLRFATHPMVIGPTNIRFVAGMPLRLSDGNRIGALCVMDTKPRWLADPQRGVLLHLARTIARALEAHSPKRAVQPAQPAPPPSLGADTTILDDQWRRDAPDAWADTEPNQPKIEAPEPRELLRTALRLVGDAVVLTDSQGNVSAINPAAERITGWTNEGAQGRPLPDLLRLVDPQSRAEQATLDASEGEKNRVESLLINRNGSEFQVISHSAPLHNARGAEIGRLLVLHDRSETLRLQAELRERPHAGPSPEAGASLVDDRCFNIRLRRLLQKVREDASQHAMLYLVIDRFSLPDATSSPNLNDGLNGSLSGGLSGGLSLGLNGEPAPGLGADLPGDQVWQAVGQLLAQRVRTRDTVAWLGEDRFGVLLEHCTASQALRVAQQLCDRVETLHFKEGALRFGTGACIGLVPVDKRWGSAPPLLEAAANACQTARDRGRGHVYAWLDSDQAEQARLRELQVGARIQQSLLVTPPPQDLESLQISSYSQASQGIDGDFIEFIRVSPHALDVIAGDVMGKGMAAAMMGAATKLQFSRSMAELVAANGQTGKLPTPGEVVTAVHRAMTPALQALEAFVTLCYLRIDTAANTVTWVGCGHEEPLLLGADKSLTLLANQHPPMGVLDDIEFQQESITLAPGDGLFLCSDGVTDAIRPDGERNGRARVASAVSRRMPLHPTSAATLHSLRCDLLQEGVQAEDDVTLLVVRRTASDGSYARIELPVSLRSMKQVREFSIAQGELAGLTEEEASLLATACIEAFTNVVRHAVGLLEGAPIELVAERLEDRLILELVYLGEAFVPPTDAPDTDYGLYPEGGFGLIIMRTATDALDHLHEDGVNTIRMVRMLGGALPPSDGVADAPDLNDIEFMLLSQHR